MNVFKTLFVGIILVMLFPLFVSAQIPDPVKYQVTESPEQVEAGAIFNVVIDASIEGNWHLYSVLNDPDAGPFPTEFSANSPNFVIAGEVTESEADIEFDPNFEAELGWHSSFARFTVPVAIKTDQEGTQTLDITVFYQVCDDRVCLPPKTKSIIASVEVIGVAAEPFEGAIPREETSIESGSSANLASDGFFSFIWIALLAGFAALLTPCVFPMIPLTVSYFSKQDESKKAVGEAFFFGIAIVVTFTLLGIILAAVVGVSGAQNFAANPFVNAMIALVLIVFAFSLLGMYELQLPHQLTNYLNRKSNESSGILGILFMAMTISAVSFSCTAPFVGAVFAATAGGEWFYPIIGMVGFSAAFASPFVIFAMFPKWLESLPKSGSWMNVVKVLLGFIELAAAIKFISNVDLVLGWNMVSRPFAIASWIAIFFVAGLYLLGVFALKNEKKPETVTPGRLLFALPFLLFSFYLIPGLMGASLGIWDSWLPPKQATDVSVVGTIAAMGGAVGGGATSADEGWEKDYEKALDEAKEEGIPVFIDFTGYTCTNCRAMETNVFPLAEVQERFGEMKLVKLYTDGGSDAQKNQQLQFSLTGNVALPTYVILDPNQERVLAQELGYVNAEKFVSFLDNGINSFLSR
ncbi:MAG: thioredoxin family protein [Balneolales bacterium]|nr:thioredoxin family protein [Balneolales bacterium]